MRRGHVVTYTSPTATDPAGGTDVVTCTPASGSTFPVGTTKVVCTATDKAGVKGEASFEVEITPQVVAGPPVFSGVPAKVMKEATGASGAVVTYTSPTATDPAGGTDVVTCTPASGSTFPVGTTKVVCTATDKAGVKGEASFEVEITPQVVAGPPVFTWCAGEGHEGSDGCVGGRGDVHQPDGDRPRWWHRRRDVHPRVGVDVPGRHDQSRVHRDRQSRRQR